MNCMYRKICSLLSLLILVTMLSGCTVSSSSEAKIFTGQANVSAPSARTATATVQDLTKTFNSSAQIVFRSTTEVYLEADNVTCMESKVSIGQRVKKGDVLAVFSGNGETTRKTEYELAIKEAKTDLEDTLASFDKSIEALEEDLDELLKQDPQYVRTQINEEILRQKIAKIELQKEQAKFRAEKRIRDNRAILENISEEVDKYTVVSPIDGVVSSADYLTPGTLYSAGQHIATLYDPTKVLLYAPNNVTGTLRYGQIVSGTFSYGREKIEVSGIVVSCDDLLPDKYDFGGVLIAPLDDQNISMLQGFTEQVRGLSFSVTATDMTLPGVLTVPKDAVSYRNNAAYVYVMENGSPHLRYVQTGLSNKDTVMILSGLTEGETVTLN